MQYHRGFPFALMGIEFQEQIQIRLCGVVYVRGRKEFQAAQTTSRQYGHLATTVQNNVMLPVKFVHGVSAIQA
jgi:hypothetical protein